MIIQQRKYNNDLNIDHKTSKSWTRNRDMTPVFEGFALFTIKGREISTKYMRAKHRQETLK